MSNVNAGQQFHTNQVHYLVANITNASAATVSLGWLPAGAGVIGAGIFINAAWSGTGNEEVDLGYRNSQEGHGSSGADTDAFTETALDLDAAVGHIAGDVVSALNLFFTEPAEVIATITNTDSTTGNAWVYVSYIVLNS